jgi:hypothetical protein
MVVIRVGGQLQEIILMTHYKVQSGARSHHKESKQRARSQNGKTVGRNKRLETFHPSKIIK